MDMIDILGGLLGGKAGGSKGGTDIFGDILGRMGKAQQGRRTGPGPQPHEKGDLSSMARELEDMLGVARDRGTSRTTPLPQQPMSVPQRPSAQGGSPFDNPFARPTPGQSTTFPQADTMPRNDQARLLVCAMVNAAKADGRITPDEQQKILGQFGDAPADVVQFLRDELARPLDVREFAWSVPIGMEQQVYAMSLMAITVDSRAESDYLNELAHGLRIPSSAREQLERRYAGGA